MTSVELNGVKMFTSLSKSIQLNQCFVYLVFQILDTRKYLLFGIYTYLYTLLCVVIDSGVDVLYGIFRLMF